MAILATINKIPVSPFRRLVLLGLSLVIGESAGVGDPPLIGIVVSSCELTLPLGSVINSVVCKSSEFRLAEHGSRYRDGHAHRGCV